LNVKKRLLVSFVVLLLGIGLCAAAYWPHVSPTINHVKSRIFGPRFVLYNLWPYPDRWAALLDGVASGDASFFRSAVDLYPAIDGESADLMIDAVFTGLEHNASGAIAILVPVYGPDTVCGVIGGAEITPERAKRRLQLLQELAQRGGEGPSLGGCLSAAQQLLDEVTRRSEPSQ